MRRAPDLRAALQRRQDAAYAEAEVYLAHVQAHWSEIAPCTCYETGGHREDCAYERTMAQIDASFGGWDR